MRPLFLLALLPVIGCRIEHAPSGRPPGEPTAADSLAQVEQDSALAAGVEAALALHYQRAASRDWRAFRRTFWPGGTISRRTVPPGERSERIWIQTVEDFARRQAEPGARQAVIGERAVHVHVTGYGDVADAWVIAERRSPARRDSSRVVRGIDAFHLVRDGAEWRIVSLTATPEDPAQRLVLPAARPRRGSPATTHSGEKKSGS